MKIEMCWSLLSHVDNFIIRVENYDKTSACSWCENWPECDILWQLFLWRAANESSFCQDTEFRNLRGETLSLNQQ